LLLFAISMLFVTASNVLAHSRYDWSDPPAGGVVDGQPFVMKAYFTQELTSKSTIRVLDANGSQVDLGDGHVDLDDPDRKVMLVSLPELPVGVYTVEMVAESAEDGHAEPGSFAFGVGMAPPSAGEPAPMPADTPSASTAGSDGCAGRDAS
jgi:methionine-rich copper-binding protein CopC